MDNLKQKAYMRLKELRKEAGAILSQGREADAFKVWQRSASTAIARLFGQESRTAKDFDQVRYYPMVLSNLTGDVDYQKSFASGMRSAIAIIDAAIQEVEDYEINAEIQATAKKAEAASSSSKNNVFIVHGRDNESKEVIARFLEKLELNPIILHEQPDGGQTIIEKFERNSDVSFAVVLLTPDDIGALGSEKDNIQPRARQNVVFELGYFVGRLSRSRVCAMVRGRVEIPTDYSGIVYIQLEGDEWKLRLVKELKQAGFDVDANKAI